MNKKTVLIYPCGAENAIEVYMAIRNSVHLNVVPASAKKDHSDLVYDEEVEYLPNVNEAGFEDALNELIKRKGIDMIFPTHDTVALHLSSIRERLDCIVITSDQATMEVCRHKRLMYSALKDLSACPAVFGSPSGSITYPIFAKPDVGEGGKGTRIVSDLEQHKALAATEEDLVFVEYLPGREYTVDCFTDRHGGLLFAGPRERAEVKMGIAFRTYAVAERLNFERIAREINDRLKFRGLWFFQVKKDSAGVLKLLEVSARVAGTMGYFRHKGVNLSLLSVFDAMDMDVRVDESDFDVELFRSTLNRYKYTFHFTRVYLDLDDTLIVNGNVNIDVISFVYRCNARGREVHLITKHATNVQETLAKYHVSSGLFTSVIHVAMDQEKADHIDPEGAIFIDNWHKERAAVSLRHNIPVFDVDAVASLIAR